MDQIAALLQTITMRLDAIETQVAQVTTDDAAAAPAPEPYEPRRHDWAEKVLKVSSSNRFDKKHHIFSEWATGFLSLVGMHNANMVEAMKAASKD